MTMSTLMVRQSEISEQIVQLETNFKKDGPSRCSLSYLMKRLSSLEVLWQEFTNNHAKIVGGGECKGEYLEKNVYSKISDVYIRFKNALLASGQGSSGQSDAGSTEAKSDKESQVVQDMLNEQRTNVKAFERQVFKLDVSQLTEKWQLEDELKTLAVRWENIDKLYWKLYSIQSMEAYEKDYDRLEQVYKNIREKINRKIMGSMHQERSAPKIELPIFNGQYENWLTFKDLFSETVHLNPFISAAQKMQHLKSKLRGEAEKLVQHLGISADNYGTCWDILVNRYDNTRLLFTHYANTLLNQPSMQRPNAALIKKLHDTTLECLNGISNLDIDITNWDPLIVHILVQKLDQDTTEHYIESLKVPRSLPSLSEFLEYLEMKFMALESSDKGSRATPGTSSIVSKPQQYAYKPFNKKPTFFNNRKPVMAEEKFHKTFHAASWSCPKCNKDHALYTCREFLELSPEMRLQTVQRLRVCQNCLYSHNGKECNSTNKCKTCNRGHSTLLHDAMRKISQPTSKPGQRLGAHVSGHDLDEVLLATVQLKVQSSDGTYITLRALLDQGSQLTLITENAAQLLKLKRDKYDAVISGIGAEPSNKCKGEVTLICQSIHNNYTFNAKALIMNKLTGKLPARQVNIDNNSQITTLKLADPRFNVPGEIDILLGAEIYSEIIMDGLIKGNNSNITAQQTHLGWVICGKINTFKCHVVLNNTDNLSRFWEQEEIYENTTSTSPDDECEKLYKETTTRLADGRYQVRLPMKAGFESKLGASKQRAVAIFKHLENKMEKNKDLAKEYKKFIHEYKDLGHMKQSTKEHLVQFYLPHHEVIRLEAVTTSLRVVFNASAKSTSGQSLNDLMEGGPNLQADLQTLILQWRQYKYAFTADLEKMFRFIAVHPDDQPLQKIVWRESSKQPLASYQLCTVTYGTKAAPYLAQRTLKQLAADEGDKHPVAKAILNEKFYMDDVLFGTDTFNEARSARDELICLLKRGGFNLRKWACNEEQLVEDLPENMRNPRNFSFSDTENLKTLGLGWNPKNDLFTFASSLQNKTNMRQQYTKRQLLSEIATIFDPLGWLSPVTIKAKLLFQQLWTMNITWDEQLPAHINKEWQTIKDDLINIQKFKVPRWLGFNSSDIEVELHAFSDASEKVYSAVVYSVVRKTGKPEINIVAAKTKVAPIGKKMSLPRLELSGALLASKLVNKILQSYNNKTLKVYAWTDSMVVLGWLQGDENRWKAFVAHRVREIKTVIKPAQWSYVKSQQNPADCATRGLLPSQLAQFPLWWKGPEWLINKQEQKSTFNSADTQEEVKKHILTVQTNMPEQTVVNDLLSRCNSFTKAARTLAWVSRFTTNARGSGLRNGHLTSAELQRAHMVIIKHIQMECFDKEIKQLTTKGSVDKTSSLFKLDPQLDNQGQLRVGGRLGNSDLPNERKYPLIIPSKHRLTYLLIQQAHVATLHGGPRLAQVYLRQRYWIPGGNNIVKKQLRQCVKCIRFTAKQQYQQMGDLPKVRVTPAPPFNNCGVDYAGPVEIKANKGRGIKVCKGYIALFICMVTKAIHLELVSDLSSQTFIAALKRMTARRGVPKNMYSDNGTNFVGANRELKRQFKEHATFNSEWFHKATTDLEIEWHFNSPSWPTAGGLWESAVKSMKYHLKRVLGEQKLTFEEFTTLLTQIEACLNSRPLFALTEERDDLEYVLTPGHFLVGQPLTTLGQEDLTEEKTLTKRWQLTTKLYQDFWKRWSTEYLHQLQTRCKWNKQMENLEKGDVVIVKEDVTAPSQWPLARITEVHPGKDAMVRVVSLKTQRGTMKRPVTKLIRLPLENQTKSTPANTTTRPVHRKTRCGSLWQYLCLFLSFMSIISGSHQQTNNISPFERERQIYYDEMGNLQNIHESWKIITYFNMTTYWQGISNMDSYIAHIDGTCRQFTYRRICESILTELRQEVDDIKHNNYLLHAQHGLLPRKKRGLINAVGNIANSLFGVLDERFAEQYKQDIEKVKINENHLLSMLKNQTSIMESQNNLLQRNENSMNKQFKLIEEHIQQSDNIITYMQTKSKQDVLMTYFNSITIAANIVITKLRRTQQSLIDTLNNIHRGNIDASILSQEQILQQLRVIAARLPNHLSLPVEDIHNELSDIYKLLHVKARVSDNYFIMEVNLPLTRDIQFQLYKVIPLPILANGRSITIQPSAEYIAVNILRDLYIKLDQSDLQSCVILQENKYICTFNKPVHSMRQSKVPCELSFLTETYHNNISTCDYNTATCANEWIGLHRHNAWIYTCCDVCHLRIICNDLITSQDIHRTGIITVDQGCTIKRDETIIQTDTIYQSKLLVNPLPSYIPLPNDLNNLTKLKSPKHIDIITEDHSQTFKDMRGQIKELNKNTKLPQDLSTHDVHQYIVSYLSITLILCTTAVAGYAYSRNRRPWQREHNTIQQRPQVPRNIAHGTPVDDSAHIEMEPLPPLPRRGKKAIYAVPHKPLFNL